MPVIAFSILFASSFPDIFFTISIANSFVYAIALAVIMLFATITSFSGWYAPLFRYSSKPGKQVNFFPFNNPNLLKTVRPAQIAPIIF